MKQILYSGILIGLLMILSGCGGGGGGGTVDPGPPIVGLSAQTGEEILLNADDVVDLSALSNPMHTKYVWDFGDNISSGSNGNAPYTAYEGRSATHVYISPGSYTITLTVTPGVMTNPNGPEEWDDAWDFPASGAKSYQIPVTVTGAYPKLPPQVSIQPIFQLSFEDNITESISNRTVNWAGGAVGRFVQGLVGKAVDLSGGRYLEVPNISSLLNGKSEFTISFWARKKDMTQDRNSFLFNEGTNGWQPNLQYYMSSVSSNGYYFRMLTGGGISTTSLGVRAEYEDTLWHHYAVTYKASESKTRLYLDGKEVASGTATGNLIASAVNPLYIGFAKYDNNATSSTFNGWMDEFKIYDKALTQRDLSVGFEVWHADFHGHSAQYLYVQVPESVTANSANRMRAVITGGALGSGEIVLADRTSLNLEEKVLLKNSDLAGSPNPYILRVQYLSGSGTVIHNYEERFSKVYDGSPKVAIDENNSIRVNGALFFPVTPWGLDNDDVSSWVNNGYINSLYGQGFWGTGHAPVYTVEGYREYLDIAAAKGVTSVGPSTNWAGLGNLVNSSAGYPFGRCSDLRKLKGYVDALKGHSAQLMWQWSDEPELYGISAQQLRSWTLASHQRDPQHLVATNVMGHPYENPIDSWWAGNRHTYAYGYNAGFFGKRTPVVDVLGFDVYPINQRRSNVTDTVAKLASAIDTMQSENFYLLPMMSYVETADPGNGGETPWSPTVDQLKMLTWLNVVHEVKGINWFHYFGATPAANYIFMATFTRQITELAPVVLGPRINRSLAVSYSGSNAGPGRVDTMLREYNEKLYLIAVRVSEVAYQDKSVGAPPPPEQNYPINVTFDLGPGITAAQVYEESRSVAVTSGRQFSDSFAPYAVHIYLISK